jgi:glyoxylase-like metal-dependent hydrolase (beta-lactamase superfamily II)
MEGMKEVGDRIYRLEVPVVGALVPNVSYFIADGDGALIEPGPGAAVPAVQSAIRHLGLGQLAYIIPTHIHVDHAGGVGALAARYPTAMVLAHPRGAKHLANPARLVATTKRIYGDDFETRSGPVLPVPESRIRVVEDGDTFIVGGRTLEVIHAPGHSPDHFCILDKSLNGLFCGEALGLPPHLLPSVAPYAFDQEAYLQTIEKLRKLHPRTTSIRMEEWTSSPRRHSQGQWRTPKSTARWSWMASGTATPALTSHGASQPTSSVDSGCRSGRRARSCS